MRRIRYTIVGGLEWACAAADALPARRNGRWVPSCWGCWPLRLSNWSVQLDDRWGTDYWTNAAIVDRSKGKPSWFIRIWGDDEDEIEDAA